MKKSVKGTITPMLVVKNTNLDLGSLNNGKGVYQFTIRNTGEVPALIMGIDILNPNEVFTIETPFAITNKHFSIDFMATTEPKANKRLVIWYATLEC